MASNSNASHALKDRIKTVMKKKATSNSNTAETANLGMKTTPKISKWDVKRHLALHLKRRGRKKIQEVTIELKEAKESKKESYTLVVSLYKEVVKETDILLEQFEKLNKLIEERAERNMALKGKIVDFKRNKMKLKKLKCKLKKSKEKLMAVREKQAQLLLKLEKNEIMIQDLSAETEEWWNGGYKVYMNFTRLHNDILDMKGNVQVFCKVRPRLRNENKEKYVSLKMRGAIYVVCDAICVL